ncbi:MAG: hypothetical protein PHE83_04000 [Opitutaceae bacterium]|nr:hypothetical protein [Opitutaceae bacterium]
MIRSTTHSDAAGRAQALAAEVRFVPAAAAKRDHLSTVGADHLRTALQAHPEVRPEIVERGRALAADPTYPTPEIVGHLSRLILTSPDLADDSS